MPAPHPRMHGITHVLGGPDPVPGLLPGMTGAFDTAVISMTGLVGYWRLGESGSPWADSSGVAPPADLVVAGTGTPLSANVPGALGSGDDGAVRFNYDGHTETGGVTLSSDGTKDFGLPQVTVAAWANIQASTDTRRGHILGNMAAGTDDLQGYALQVIYPAQTVRFTVGGPRLSEDYVETPAGVVAGQWNFLVGTFDGTTIRLYVNGALYAEAAGSSSVGGAQAVIGMAARPTATFVYTYDYLLGTVDEAAIWDRALEPTELGALYEAGITTTGATVEGAGPVLGLDTNGNPAWVKPPAPAVTVNGSRSPVTLTPRPDPPPPPPPPPDVIPPAGTTMGEQPFTGGGGTFVVQPRTWTTIPFTTPRMLRASTKTDPLVGWDEIPVGDFDTGGWVHADFPHGIIVAHDFPFQTIDTVMQLALRIDSPRVEPETSDRALRIFETTHQKSVLMSYSETAGGCAFEGGQVNVYDTSGYFSEGDTGGLHNGAHDDFFMIPNYGLGYYEDGFDWLPGGMLKQGMRLVGQCWHSASVPLTFSCDGGTVYKPHLVVNAIADATWGPPWSTWLP